jgi:hypothetical protein
VLRNASNIGHGPSAVAAYRAGLELGPDVIIHVDGDGQFVGDDFPRLLDTLAASRRTVGVVGSRAGRREPWFRRLLTRAARVSVGRVLTGDDVNSPLRAYRADTVRRLLDALPGLSVVPHLHFAVLHRRLGLAVAEIAVTHRPRRGTTTVGTTWQSGPRAAFLPSRRLLGLAWRAQVELRAARTAPCAAPVLVGDVAADAA